MAAPAPVQAPLTDRLATFVQAHRRAVILAVSTTAVVVAGASYLYLRAAGPEHSGPKKKKKTKGKPKKAPSDKAPEEREDVDDDGTPTARDSAHVADPLRLTASEIELLAPDERARLAVLLKQRGNKAYSGKQYEEAVELYSKAIECEEQAVYYSNRAACYTNLNLPAKVVEDTTNALRLDPSYLKALNRRGMALEQMGGVDHLYSSLCDFTAAAIIDNFKTDSTQVSVERVMKRLAQEKGTAMLRNRDPRLPSSTFIKAYLEAFRPQENPTLPEVPSSGDRTLMLAFDALDARSYIHAFTLFNEALLQGLSAPKLESKALNMRATFRFIMGDAAAALEDLDRCTTLCPDDTQSYVKKASVHMELGMPEEAFADFDKALLIEPDNPDVFYHRGQVYFITGDYEKAIVEYRRSSEIDPIFIFSHIQLAVAQYKNSSVEKAMLQFRRLSDKFPSSPEVANYHGELLLDQQSYEEAVAKFERSIELDKNTTPRNVLPMINRALALFQWRQDFAQAEAICREAIAIDPACDVGVATLAQLLLQQNKVEEAAEMFAKSAEMSRTEPELVNALTYENATRAQIAFVKGWPEHAAALGLSSRTE